VTEPTSPLISVVVPFLNCERYLKRCLDALEAQTLPREDFEVLMVDNGSVDSSAAIVRSYAGVRLQTEPRPGGYRARNRGIAEASGDVIAFTDADCAPSTDWLARILDGMRDPTVQVVQGSWAHSGESWILGLVASYEAVKNHLIFSGSSSDLYYACANNLAVRRRVFAEVGPFVEMSHGADVVLVQRVISAFGKDSVCYRPDARLKHLELDGLAAWFRKMFKYGRSYEDYRSVEACRALNYRERVSVFRRGFNQGLFSWHEAPFLLGALVAGAAWYEGGRASARVLNSLTMR
jgi:glycosyltransferase involved in cell wall biosynthesis